MEEEIKKKNRKRAEIWALKSFRDRSSSRMEEERMSSTALGAEKEKAIIFISDAHEKFYYEKLKEVRYQDVYHKALVYCLGISDDTRRNIKSIYNFKTGCVKTECLHEGWQTSGSVKVVRMAFNLLDRLQ